MKLQGAMTAMVTPFAQGGIDWDRLAANVAYQIESGIDALVPCGTTGESPTLSHEEHRAVIEKTVELARGRALVIPGTGSNATSEALALTRHAQSVGADAALMVNPYYNKPTQEGLYRHFMTVADAVDLPIVLYNIPGRTGVTLAPDTVARLARHARILGIKEATGSMDSASAIAQSCGEQITILSGDDSMTLPLMAVGAKGAISVLSNLVPGRIKALTDAALAEDAATARRLHLELFKLCKGCLTLATNPIPIKAALAIAGMDSGELRLPMTPLEPAPRRALEAMLEEAGVLPVEA